ncbi:hypothetical protein Q4595_03775 [Wenyingzhuangia sp. 1_MG-2023]|nr:hypothetical protein [Wenyingzhuangia sp. 1_MG-2023]
MKKWLFFLILKSFFLVGQEKQEDCILIVNPQKKQANFSMPIKKKTEIDDFKLIEKAINASPFVQGYKYKFNIKTVENLLPIQAWSDFLKNQNQSLFNPNLLKNYNSDLKFNSSVNINGITQVVTLKGILNEYQGNYSLQISYHISTNNTDYIPKIVNEKYQEGIGLKLKLNLERGK